ncbi:MAG: pyroglutamyl-peptidase I [Thermoactinomyces sp.]
MKTVLLTGFDPFDGETINPSYEAAKRLHGKTIKGFKVIAEEMPTVFDRSIKQLYQLIDLHQPGIVICTGQAGGRDSVSIERVAININDARIPDNDGQQPIDTPILEDGPVAYWSSLPIKEIVKKIKEDGIPAHVSHTAGTFVCNHVFYGLMHRLQGEKGVRGGFIHIPFLPEQAVHHPGQPSMHLDDITRAFELAIEATIQTEDDIRETGGTIS